MEYRMGKKLERYGRLLILLSMLIVYGFCYIYGCVFQSMQAAYSVNLLILAFTGIECAVIIGIKKGLQYFRDHCYYIFSEDSFTVCNGRKKTCYPWEAFAEARFDYTRVIGMNYFPVIFIAGGKMLRLNKYVNDFNGLTVKMLGKITASARLQDDLWEKLSAYDCASAKTEN